MADSTSIADDPTWEDLIAFYIDGNYATTESAVRARFPKAVLVPISAVGTNAGLVGDVEPGCMSADYAVRWVQWRRQAGVEPSLYVNETYGWAPCRAAFAAAGVREPVGWWVADYDNVPAVPAGAIAKQYANPPLDGGHFDQSIVADFWPGIDSPGGAMTDSDLDLIHDRMQFAIWGVVDTSDQSRAAFRYAVNHGTSVASIDAGWRANAQAATWQAELGKLNAPPAPSEPYFLVTYTFTPSSASLPTNEVVKLSDAVAFAQQFEKDHPGVVVNITADVPPAAAAA